MGAGASGDRVRRAGEVFFGTRDAAVVKGVVSEIQTCWSQWFAEKIIIFMPCSVL